MALELSIYNTLLVGALVLILTWLITYFWNINRKLPPGPWGLPFIGYYPYISDRPHEDFLKLSKKYGNVFSFRTLGGRLIIILNGTKVIKEILINRADEFIGRPRGNNVITLMSDGIGITQEDGIPWKEQRRFFLHNLKNFGVGKAEMENHIADEIRSMLKILRKNTGRSTEIQPHLAYVTSSIVSQIVFSSKLDRNDPRMPKILRCGQGLRELFVGRTNYLVGWIQDLYATISPTHRKAIKDRDYVRKITDAFIDERLTSFDPDHIKDYVDVYLSKRNELLKSGKLNESSFSMERLQAISFNLFFEGMESVSSAIMGLLIELSKHLSVQCEAQKEIDNVVGRERLPAWSDRLNLPYLDSTIQELYRFAAPFLVTTQYSNFDETTIEGYRIPRRSVIVSNLWSMNLDPDVFEEPEKFNPRRYLNSEGRRIKISGPYPFGLGKRSCVGESFAQVEVFLIIASLLQNFELHPGDDDESLKLVER